MALAQPMGRQHAGVGCFAGQGVSVIVPAYADSERLRRLLWSVHATADLPFQLVVALGQPSVAASRNAGLTRATEDLVVFVDDDVLLPACWMSRLVAALAAHPQLGAVSALLRFPDGRPQMRRHDLRPGELWDVTCPGTCFGYSRARVGDQRFDERYRGSQWEDTDWMWSVRARGLRTAVTGAVHVVHEHRMVQGEWAAANSAAFRAKWGRLPEVDEVAAIDLATLHGWQLPALGEEAAVAR